MRTYLHCIVWGCAFLGWTLDSALGESMSSLDERIDTFSTAIEVGETQITFFELAHLFTSLPQGSEHAGEASETLISLAPVIQDAVFAELGRNRGILDTDEFKISLKHVQKLILWQEFAGRRKIYKEELECMENQDCILAIGPSLLNDLKGGFQFLEEEPPRNRKSAELLLHLDGNTVTKLYELIETFLISSSPKERLDLRPDLLGDDELLKWFLEDRTGVYRVKEFVEDFNGMSMRKTRYDVREFRRLVIDHFFSREHFEYMSRSGHLEKDFVRNGFANYGRRYAKGEYFKLLREEVPDPTESELISFFEDRAERFVIPESVIMGTYRFPRENRRAAQMMRMGLIHSPEYNPEIRGGVWEEVTVDDPRFSRVYSLAPEQVDFIEDEDGGYEVVQKIKQKGERLAEFDEVVMIVEQQWQEWKFQEMLESEKRKLLAGHPVVLHPRFSEVTSSNSFRALMVAANK